uniref:Arginine repressor C-terminal-like domain-containing protein n=1 Tax=Tanacetum cinerariifolium TaxID=118510 RepID=A0A6L2LTD8_TANCI|nr:arginine repressor C-terminal-like domain-containing protein [Tanacetum cinerariifolium]
MATLDNQKLLLFKVDFEKAFDSGNWDFLMSIMTQMGFRDKWRNWIFSCLSSASISVMINRSPSKEFKMKRGLRQCDSLHPLLFHLIAEALQISIIEACKKGVFNGVSLAKSKVNVSLLQYWDDALFFREWSRKNAKNLIHILKCFEKCSDLKVNISKSRIIGVGVRSIEVKAVATSLGCANDSLPFIYLGPSVGKRMRYRDGWNVVIEHFRNKLTCLKAKSSSIEDKALRNIDIKEFYGVDEGFNSTVSHNEVGGIWHDIISVVKGIDQIDVGFKSSFVQKVIAYRANLASRGVVLEFANCPFCDNIIEDLDHYVIKCPVILPIWRKVWSWWDMVPPVVFPSLTIYDIARDTTPTIKEKDIFPTIQRLSRTWIRAHGAFKQANWDV